MIDQTADKIVQTEGFVIVVPNIALVKHQLFPQTVAQTDLCRGTGINVNAVAVDHQTVGQTNGLQIHIEARCLHKNGAFVCYDDLLRKEGGVSQFTQTVGIDLIGIAVALVEKRPRHINRCLAVFVRIHIFVECCDGFGVLDFLHFRTEREPVRSVFFRKYGIADAVFDINRKQRIGVISKIILHDNLPF